MEELCLTNSTPSGRSNIQKCNPPLSIGHSCCNSLLVWKTYALPTLPTYEDAIIPTLVHRPQLLQQPTDVVELCLTWAVAIYKNHALRFVKPSGPRVQHSIISYVHKSNQAMQPLSPVVFGSTSMTPLRNRNKRELLTYILQNPSSVSPHDDMMHYSAFGHVSCTIYPVHHLGFGYFKNTVFFGERQQDKMSTHKDQYAPLMTAQEVVCFFILQREGVTYRLARQYGIFSIFHFSIKSKL